MQRFGGKWLHTLGLVSHAWNEVRTIPELRVTDQGDRFLGLGDAAVTRGAPAFLLS